MPTSPLHHIFLLAGGGGGGLNPKHRIEALIRSLVLSLMPVYKGGREVHSIAEYFYRVRANSLPGSIRGPLNPRMQPLRLRISVFLYHIF